MVDRWLTATLAVASMGLAACGDDNGGEVRTVTVAAATEPAAEQETPVTGDAILIETRITSAQRHTGRVLSQSRIGERPFCPGGTETGGGAQPIIQTFHCPDGRLKIQFAPTQPSYVQSAAWSVVSGTGRYRGLRGEGFMVARFEGDNREIGRETFTGTIGK